MAKKNLFLGKKNLLLAKKNLLLAKKNLFLAKKNLVGKEESPGPGPARQILAGLGGYIMMKYKFIAINNYVWTIKN